MLARIDAREDSPAKRWLAQLVPQSGIRHNPLNVCSPSRAYGLRPVLIRWRAVHTPCRAVLMCLF